MRTRLVTLLSAALLVVMAMPAFAQYPPVNPGDDPASSLTCIVTVPATASAAGEVSCAAAGLAPGTPFSFTITFPLIQGTAASFSASSAAVAYVGAQSGNSVTISGTVGPDGVAQGSAAVPAGTDTSAVGTASLFGTAADGTAVTASTTLNAPADTGAETVAATGAESGVLALIALGLVGAGAGAVLLARRKNHVEA